MSVVHPQLCYRKTAKFTVIDLIDLIGNNGNSNDGSDSNSVPRVGVLSIWNCAYTESVLIQCMRKRSSTSRLYFNDIEYKKCLAKHAKVMKGIQFGDFENINWESVMAGQEMASSYLVRKGLSRKAQLALQMKRYLSKHPNSCLKQAVPFTLIIETWNAFEDMRIEFGGGFMATFDARSMVTMPLRERLELSLEDIKAEMQNEARVSWTWILKPSVTNKGADIVILRDFDGLLDALEAVPDMREWVLQRYIDKPMLLFGHKFHIRVYVLCVGALKVHVFDEMLVLLAAHSYDSSDLDDIYRHLTNTARSAEDINFEEEKFVKVLDDIPALIASSSATSTIPENIRSQIHHITHELFAAFENEYTVFAPMSNCFELYGLDFLVEQSELDDSIQVSLLEVNPGPDFKQTGSTLKTVIEHLIEETLQLVVDPIVGSSDGSVVDEIYPEVNHETGFPLVTEHMSLVYSKEWSVSKMRGGMQFK